MFQVHLYFFYMQWMHYCTYVCMTDVFLFWTVACAHLYVIRAVHHDCPVLLTVYIWSRLPQLFGLVPLPLSRLNI